MSWMFIFLKPQGTSSRERWKSDCRQAKIICSNPLPPQGTSSGGRWKKPIFGRRKSLFQAPCPPQGTSSGGRWKNDYRQAPRHQDGKTIYRQAKATFGGRWQKRLSASENHFFKPLFQGSSKEKLKNDYRQANIIFSSPWHQLWKKMEKKRFSAGKNHFFSTYPFQGTSKRMTFSKQKPPFQILAPSNHELWKNKQQTIFRIRNSLSQSNFIPDSRFFQAKSKQIRPYAGPICESYRFSSLSFCLKIN